MLFLIIRRYRTQPAVLLMASVRVLAVWLVIDGWRWGSVVFPVPSSLGHPLEWEHPPRARGKDRPSHRRR